MSDAAKSRCTDADGFVDARPLVTSNDCIRSCNPGGRWYIDSCSCFPLVSPLATAVVSLLGAAGSFLSVTGVGAFVVAADTFGLNAGVRDRSSVAATDAGLGTGCAGATLGEATDEGFDTGTATGYAGLAPGGGGKGAIPTPFLSLAAAAAAADAYLSVSPGRRVGGGAGFMPLVALVEVEGCRVARTGRGDFICVDDRRGPGVVSALGLGFESDASSSCSDCVSCDDTRSFSPACTSAASFSRSRSS